MIQQFIELGEGYGDVYELLALIDTNKHRFHQALILTSEKNGNTVASLAVAFKPVSDSKFMPIYICREGIPYKEDKPSKRIELFTAAVQSLNREPVVIEVKHSSIYKETALFYQYLTGILRLHHYIPQL